MERLHTLGQVRDACADPLVLWAAQDMGAAVQVWSHDSAGAAAVTGLARRHRLAVTGAVTDIAVIVRTLLDRPGPGYRPLGDDATIVRLCDLVPALTPSRSFGWMTATQAPCPVPGAARPARTGEEEAIDRILDESLPDSLARPGRPGVSRWWVSADHAGLAACAALTYINNAPSNPHLVIIFDLYQRHFQAVSGQLAWRPQALAGLMEQGNDQENARTFAVSRIRDDISGLRAGRR